MSKWPGPQSILYIVPIPEYHEVCTTQQHIATSQFKRLDLPTFFSHRSNSRFNGRTFWRFSRLMMLHVPRARSMTNWASICGLRCNQKENRNTHHTVGPTGIDVEHHLQGNYDTRTTTLEIYFSERKKKDSKENPPVFC